RARDRPVGGLRRLGGRADGRGARLPRGLVGEPPAAEPAEPKARCPTRSRSHSDVSDEPAAGRAGLVRSSAAVAAGTLLSRLTGLLRVVVLAAVIGKASLADTYNLA